jgi:hypothetical protein
MKAFPIIFICFLSFACEGDRIGKGIIYDAQTHQPLDSVAYKEVGDDMVFYTDSTGRYLITGPFGSCQFGGCPDFTAEFAKTGYETKSVGNPDGDIFMEAE